MYCSLYYNFYVLQIYMETYEMDMMLSLLPLSVWQNINGKIDLKYRQQRLVKY